MRAGSRGRTEVVRTLVNAGADVNACNLEGMSALHVAASSDNPYDTFIATMGVLVDAGGVDFRDEDGMRVIDYVERFNPGAIEVIEVLFEASERRQAVGEGLNEVGIPSAVGPSL